MKIINCVSLFIVSVTLYNCSKKSTEQNNAESLKIIALEKVTRKPILGAAVDLLKCTKYDIQFGCMRYESIRTFSTDSQGEIRYTLINEVEAMEAAHPDYWKTFQKGSSGEILLSPNAWVKVQLEKTGTYDAGSYVNIVVTRECHNCGGFNFYLNYDKRVGLPADTTFIVTIEATEKTTVYWNVITPTPAIPYNVVKSGSSQPFVLGKFDTIGVKFQY